MCHWQREGRKPGAEPEYLPYCESLMAFCRENGLLFLLDTAQTAGAFPIDMEAMGADALAFTGHKGLMGPQGQ